MVPRITTRLLSHMPTLLFLGVFLFGAVASRGIGPAWDEPDNIFSGGQYATFFRNGLNPSILSRRDPDASAFGERIYTQEPAIARYPPIPNYVGTLITTIQNAGSNPSGRDIIASFHVATALFFALLVATTFRFAVLLGFSVWESLLAALLTFTYPTLFGHGLSNLKDTAQIALFTLTLYYLVRFTRLRQMRDLIAGSVVWGLALASKFNAIYIPIIWMCWTLLIKRRKTVSFAPHFFTVLSGGLAVMIMVWPYLWFDPTGRIGEVIAYFTTVGRGYRLFWDGTLYQVGVGQILWWYPFANIMLGTPLPLLILLVSGVWSGIHSIRVHTRHQELVYLLLCWITVPLLRAFLPNAAFYDGMRHFMEIIPALMLLSVFGLRYLRTLGNLGRFAPLVALLVLAQLTVINVLYFPYSTGYLNMLARNANGRFDRDIEALSVKEAVDYVHRKYGRMTVWSPIGGHLSWYYLTPKDRYVYSASEADTVILVNKSSHIREKEFVEALPKRLALTHVIMRDGAVFAWIYRQP